jgi:hypothetical protein
MGDIEKLDEANRCLVLNSPFAHSGEVRSIVYGCLYGEPK